LLIRSQFVALSVVSRWCRNGVSGSFCCCGGLMLLHRHKHLPSPALQNQRWSPSRRHVLLTPATTFASSATSPPTEQSTPRLHATAETVVKQIVLAGSTGLNAGQIDIYYGPTIRNSAITGNTVSIYDDDPSSAKVADTVVGGYGVDYGGPNGGLSWRSTRTTPAAQNATFG
jgi:hypothetical protein